ncbi:MAG: hypothetical protein JWR04_1690 [Rhodoglobus sp.]|nr:hypothetical protein [Rhodoglobus sp.]
MRIPSVMMRGGTSRGLFFHDSDLPQDQAARERVVLAALGSPDPNRRQINGAGGATSNTSKVAIIAPGTEPGIDVNYTFGQVSIDRPLIDWSGNCGNISSAVGGFAIDEGLVEATGSETVVRFLNTNTNKVIVAHVPTKDGAFDPVGELEIPGVPGTGSPIRLDYLDPGGALTGSVLPTGSPSDVLHLGEGDITVSLVDAANPLVFVRFSDVGMTGLESASDIDGDPSLLARLERIRAAAGELAGIAPSAAEISASYPSVPKMALVGPPMAYTRSDGVELGAADTSLRMTMLSMGRAHPAVALTGAICTAVAAKIPGTLAYEAAGSPASDEVTRIGHLAGVMNVTAEPEQVDGVWSVESVAVFRTARRIFDGGVHVPDSVL